MNKVEKISIVITLICLLLLTFRNIYYIDNKVAMKKECQTKTYVTISYDKYKKVHEKFGNRNCTELIIKCIPEEE